MDCVDYFIQLWQTDGGYMLQIKLIVFGNPDYGQDPNKPPYGVKPRTISAEDIKQLRTKVRQWQTDNCVGGGNWGSPAVYKDGKLLGYMSYNGKLWDKNVFNGQGQEIAL